MTDPTAGETGPSTSSSPSAASANPSPDGSNPSQDGAAPAAAPHSAFDLGSWQRDFRAVLGFFTRLPVGRAPDGDLAAAARAFPLAGLVVGLIGAFVYLGAVKLGLSGLLAALLAVAATGALTGALHEDGLADVADGLGVRGDRARKLAVMKESHIGSFGTLALIFATAIKVAALAALGTPELVAGALIAAHVLARGVLPLAMRSLPVVRPGGLADRAGKPTAEGVYWSLGLALAAALFSVYLPAAIVALVAAVAAAILIGKLAERQFGGYTGDVLGAIEQVAEIAVLVNLVTLAP